MSAWWTSKRHVDLIVTAAIALKVIEAEKAQATGKLLRLGNAQSLMERYGDSFEMYREDVDGYTFKPVPDENLLGIFVAVRSYDYQACETEDYRNTFPWKFCDDLCKAICAKLSLTHDEAYGLAKQNNYVHGENGYWSVLNGRS